MIKTTSPLIVIYSKDIESTHNFYKALGAIINKKEEDRVVVNIGGHDIHFIKESTEPFPEYQFATDPVKRGQGILFYAEVENIEEFYNKVKRDELLKGSIVTGVKDNHWECREFMVKDEDGVMVVFWE